MESSYGLFTNQLRNNTFCSWVMSCLVGFTERSGKWEVISSFDPIYFGQKSDSRCYQSGFFYSSFGAICARMFAHSFNTISPKWFVPFELLQNAVDDGALNVSYENHFCCSKDMMQSIIKSQIPLLTATDILIQLSFLSIFLNAMACWQQLLSLAAHVSLYFVSLVVMSYYVLFFLVLSKVTIARKQLLPWLILYSCFSERTILKLFLSIAMLYYDRTSYFRVVFRKS